MISIYDIIIDIIGVIFPIDIFPIHINITIILSM